MTIIKSTKLIINLSDLDFENYPNENSNFFINSISTILNKKPDENFDLTSWSWTLFDITIEKFEKIQNLIRVDSIAIGKL